MLKENETIIDQWRSGHSNDLIELKNKTPTYNEGYSIYKNKSFNLVSKLYTLNLKGNRFKQPSNKNFQIISSNEEHMFIYILNKICICFDIDENNVVMQFGRIDDNNFALDYRYPLTAIQAFAIGSSSFHKDDTKVRACYFSVGTPIAAETLSFSPLEVRLCCISIVKSRSKPLTSFHFN